mmetsp:Transcript_5715/g.20096  ORF Transcript_5715/g.20096 Transcript_5715/m.20096 type:complete len:166 (+) Transcript_5715:982-1479(+)
MIKSDKQNVVAAAVHALCALARDSQNQVLIARKNLIPHLLKKANCGVDEIEQGITLTLALLAQSNINRPKIMFHGGFKPLIYNAQYGKTDEVRKRSQSVLTSLFKLPGAKRDELVRRAANKFKEGLKMRRTSLVSKEEYRESKAVQASQLIFGQGGNDEDSSDED